MIAAGSTGSMPATAKLLATIAKLPHGAVVLPGLDTDLDDATWTLIGGANDGDADEPPASAIRNSPCRRCSRASASRATRSLRWRRRRTAASGSSRRRCGPPARPSAGSSADAIDVAAQPTPRSTDITVIEAANAEEEALAIAVALREAMETPDKTAALVTPDRALARRVLAALARWNIAGRRFRRRRARRHRAGVFARLAARGGARAACSR